MIPFSRRRGAPSPNRSLTRRSRDRLTRLLRSGVPGSRVRLLICGFVPLFVIALVALHTTSVPPSGPNRTCATTCKCGPAGQSLAPKEGAPKENGPKENGEAPRTPNPWFFLERAYPFGRIPRELWQQAQLEARMLKEAGGTRGTWEFRGPTNIGGRITDIAVDPIDPAVAFAAAAEGGVLRTTDSGGHWTPVFDRQSTISVGAVALDPVNSPILYAGTGEVNPGGGSVAYGGSGIFRSTDRGDSWVPLGLENSGSIGRIRIDPTDPQRIYVAAMGDLWSKGPDRGVYRSIDGGASWEKVLYASDSTGAVDLILRPDQPRTLFAAMWERIRRPGSYQYGGATCGVYKTTDGGDHWTMAGGGLPAPSSNIGRIGLSLCASQPANMAAIYADRTGYFAGVYKSTNGGDAWTRTNDGALANVYSSYGWWFGNIRIHPADPNRFFVLGLDFYRSTNGGTSWSNVGSSMHVDHHAMEFGSGASPLIYEGNDGGVYRSTNGGAAWLLLPNQPITQIYRLAVTPQNENILYAGAQDNGTVRTLTNSTGGWTMVYGGDGFGPMIDPTNSSRVWAQYQYGALAYSNNGGGSWVDATGGISYSDRFNWNTPVRMDPNNPNRLYYGTQRVYRSLNGTTWSAISPDLTGGPGGGDQGQVYGTLTTLDVSPLDGQVIWAGSDDGHVQVTTNGGTNWTDVSIALPDRWVTSVCSGLQTREVCYVTISGFRWDSPLPHVFRTTNLGTSWAPIAGNLPEAPANDIAQDPTDGPRLFVATDVGVYESLNGGQNWSVLGGDLPNVVVTQLAFQSGPRKLIAATYGRSFFSYQVDQPSSVELFASNLASSRIVVSPSPAREGSSISWSLPNESQTAGVKVAIYSVSGRRVWERTDAQGKTWWDRRDAAGHRVPAGTYLCRVTTARGEIGRQSLVVLD